MRITEVVRLHAVSGLIPNMACVFCNCLLHLILDTVDRLGTHKRFPETRIRCILESGAKSAGDAKRIFDETKNDMERIGLNLLDALIFASEKDYDELWLADFLAFMTFQRGDAEPAEPSFPYSPIRFSPDKPTRQKGELTLLRFAPGGLEHMKLALIEQMQAKVRPSLSASHDPKGGSPS